MKNASIFNVQPKDTSRGHLYVSLAKSAIRIAAGFGLMSGFIIFAGMALVFAEVLGVVEELV